MRGHQALLRFGFSASIAKLRDLAGSCGALLDGRSDLASSGVPFNPPQARYATAAPVHRAVLASLARHAGAYGEARCGGDASALASSEVMAVIKREVLQTFLAIGETPTYMPQGCWHGHSFGAVALRTCPAHTVVAASMFVFVTRLPFSFSFKIRGPGNELPAGPAAAVF